MALAQWEYFLLRPHAPVADYLIGILTATTVAAPQSSTTWAIAHGGMMTTLKKRETRAERIRRKLDEITQDEVAFKRLILVVINEIKDEEPYRTKRAIVIGGKWYPFQLRGRETWQEAFKRLNREPTQSVEEKTREASK